MSEKNLSKNADNDKLTRYCDLPEAKDAIIGLMEITNALSTIAHVFESGFLHGDFEEQVEAFEGFQGVFLALSHRHRALVTALDIEMERHEEEESDAAV